MLKYANEPSRVEYYIMKLDDVESAMQEPKGAMKLTTVDDTFEGACIRCIKPRCVRYFDEEYLCDAIQNFVANVDDEVCAFGAVSIDKDTRDIAIDENLCCGCGICARRCPLGAISIESNTAHVNNSRPNRHYAAVDLDENIATIQERCAKELDTIARHRILRTGTSEEVQNVYHSLLDKPHRNDTALLFCRNLLLETGLKCSLKRTGDVYTRMDAVYSWQDVCGAIEIEFGTDTLSVARNLLDDVAIMATRYEIPSAENHPLAVLATIPNTRQGYLQVLDDIQTVLGVDIRTVTIGALLLLVWDGSTLDFSDEKFHIAFRDSSIKEDLEAILGHEIQPDETGIGYLDSKK